MKGITELQVGTWAYPLEDFEHDAQGRPMTLANICAKINEGLAPINKAGGQVHGLLRVNALDAGSSPSGIGNQHIGAIIFIEKRGEENA